MKRLIIFPFVSLCILTSCNLKFPVGDTMTQSWKFSHMDDSDSLSVTEGVDAQILDTVYKRFTEGYLRLYPGKRYTFVGNRVSSLSQWSFRRADSILTIDSFIGGIQLRFKVIEYSDKWLRMDLTGFGKRAIHHSDHTLLFALDPYFEYSDIDLLNYEHNTWRIKPAHKENHAEIKKRVTDHIDYMIAYFQMIEDDNRNSFIPMYLQSTMKFYQNGIALENQYAMNRGWEDCFYDHEDALAASTIMGDGITGMGPYPNAKNFTEGYMKALKMMKEYLGKVK